MIPVLLLLSIWPFQHPAPDVTIERHHVDAWNITIRHSRFTGGDTCILSAPAMAVDRDALIIYFGHRRNTVEAKYRINDGPLVSASSHTSELAAQGFTLYTDDLINPSGGVVRIPLNRLKDAQSVTVQVHDGERPRAFELAGLRQALSLASERGCSRQPPST